MDGGDVQEVGRLKLSRVLNLNKRLDLKVTPCNPTANFISSFLKIYPESDHYLETLSSQFCSSHYKFSPEIL